MIELDYAALRATPVATEPFPHVVVPNFVPPAALRAVVADLPPMGRRGSFPLDALPLGPNARALMDELDGAAAPANDRRALRSRPRRRTDDGHAARLDQ